MPRQLPPSPNILVFDEVLRDVTPPKPLYRTQYFHNRDLVKRHGYQFQVILLFVCLPELKISCFISHRFLSCVFIRGEYFPIRIKYFLFVLANSSASFYFAGNSFPPDKK